jgi:hypothetical protein
MRRALVLTASPSKFCTPAPLGAVAATPATKHQTKKNKSQKAKNKFFV